MTALSLALALLHAAAPLTEDAAVERARLASPELRALERRVDEERAGEEASTKLENPELRVQNLRSDRLLSPAVDGTAYADHPFERTKVGVRWSPPKLGEWSARRAQAAVDVARSEAELEQGRRDFAAHVRALHATVLGLDAQIALVGEATGQREALRQQVERLREEHAATKLDLDLVGLEVLDATVDLKELQEARRRAHDELAALLGAAPGEALELSAEGAPECADPADLAALLARAGANSLSSRRLAARQAEVEAERSRSTLGLVPWFDFVQLAYVARGDTDPDYAELSFALSLPLLEWGCADRKLLDARRARLLEQEKAEAAQLERDVRRARQRVLDQAAVVSCYRSAEPLMAQSVASLSQASAAREMEVAMVTRIEARVLKARRAHQKARLECRLAQVELERLAGPAAAAQGR